LSIEPRDSIDSSCAWTSFNVSLPSSSVINTTELSDSTAITYSISPNVSSVNEGGTVTFSVTATNFGNGILYWTHNGSTNGFDFTDGQTNGSVNIVNDRGSFTRTLVNDTTTEGPQSFTIELRTTNTNGTIVDTSSTITVVDTSLSTPVYNLIPVTGSINEGSSLTFNITGVNILNGTYYWSVSNPGDFATSGASVTITNNVGSFSVTPRADTTTEGAESFVAYLRTAANGGGTLLATSSLVTINDTSTSAASFTLTPNITTVNEGDNVIFTVSGSNIQDNLYYWTINNSTSVNNDFSGTFGAFGISNNTGTFTVSVSADSLTEGTERFSVYLRYGSSTGNILAESSLITINDTSIGVTYAFEEPQITSMNEGVTQSFRVNTTSVPNGTALYWYIVVSGNNPTSSDFSAMNGTITILNNTGTFNVTTTAGGFTEGPETFSIGIKRNTSGDYVLLSNNIVINDTSLATTYIVTPRSSSVNEGSSLTFDVSGTAIGNGTYYYTINYSGNLNTADFNLVNSSGPVVITNNTGSFFVTVISDYLPEGAESFTVSLRADSTNGTVLTTSSSVAINDTSAGPVITNYPPVTTWNTPFSYGITGGRSNETWTSSWSGAFSGTSNGTLAADGTASYNNGDFGKNYGTVTVTWTFAQSGTRTKTVTNQPIQPIVSYVSSIARGATFTWSMIGAENEIVDCVVSGANTLTTSFTLSNTGTYVSTNSVFTSSGATTLTFTFRNTFRVNNQTVVKTVNVT